MKVSDHIGQTRFSNSKITRRNHIRLFMRDIMVWNLLYLPYNTLTPVCLLCKFNSKKQQASNACNQKEQRSIHLLACTLTHSLFSHLTVHSQFPYPLSSLWVLLLLHRYPCLAMSWRQQVRLTHSLTPSLTVYSYLLILSPLIHKQWSTAPQISSGTWFRTSTSRGGIWWTASPSTMEGPPRRSGPTPPSSSRMVYLGMSLMIWDLFYVLCYVELCCTVLYVTVLCCAMTCIHSLLFFPPRMTPLTRPVNIIGLLKLWNTVVSRNLSPLK